jgi:hypothetical protein
MIPISAWDNVNSFLSFQPSAISSQLFRVAANLGGSFSDKLLIADG